MMTEMIEMTCCEHPYMPESDTSQDSNSSSDLSNGSNDSCPSPPMKRQHIDKKGTGNAVLDLFFKKFGPDFDLEEFKKKQGSNFWYPCLWDPPLMSENKVVVVDQRHGYVKYAELALKVFKETEGEEYEYKKARSLYQIASTRTSHFNFFASSKYTETIHLFYAELLHSDHSDKVVKVVLCSIVDSRPSNDIIVHPDGVNCSECNVVGFDCSNFESDDEF